MSLIACKREAVFELEGNSEQVLQRTYRWIKISDSSGTSILSFDSSGFKWSFLVTGEIIPVKQPR